LSVLTKKELPSLPLPKDAKKNIVFMFLCFYVFR